MASFNAFITPDRPEWTPSHTLELVLNLRDAHLVSTRSYGPFKVLFSKKWETVLQEPYKEELFGKDVSLRDRLLQIERITSVEIDQTMSEELWGIEMVEVKKKGSP